MIDDLHNYVEVISKRGTDYFHTVQIISVSRLRFKIFENGVNTMRNIVEDKGSP